jgi:hypothetical protein
MDTDEHGYGEKGVAATTTALEVADPVVAVASFSPLPYPCSSVFIRG